MDRLDYTTVKNKTKQKKNLSNSVQQRFILFTHFVSRRHHPFLSLGDAGGHCPHHTLSQSAQKRKLHTHRQGTQSLGSQSDTAEGFSTSPQA